MITLKRWMGEEKHIYVPSVLVLIPFVCDLGCWLLVTVSCRGHELADSARETRFVRHTGFFSSTEEINICFPSRSLEMDVLTPDNLCSSVKPLNPPKSQTLFSVNRTHSCGKGHGCFTREMCFAREFRCSHAWSFVVIIVTRKLISKVLLLKCVRNSLVSIGFQMFWASPS